MPISKDQAILLYKTDLKDHDEIGSFLTREHGVIQIVCRGTRRARGRQTGLMEIPNVLDLIYYEKESSELANLNQANLAEGWIRLRTDMYRMATALFLGEITRKCLAMADPYPRVYEALLETLQALQHGAAPIRATIRFLLFLLAESGHFPEVRRCVVCQGAEKADLEAFSPHLGGMLCAACRGADAQALKVGGRLIRSLRESFGAAGPNPDVARELDEADLRPMRLVLVRFLQAQFEFHVKSFTFLQMTEDLE